MKKIKIFSTDLLGNKRLPFENQDLQSFNLCLFERIRSSFIIRSLLIIMMLGGAGCNSPSSNPASQESTNSPSVENVDQPPEQISESRETSGDNPLAAGADKDSAEEGLTEAQDKKTDTVEAATSTGFQDIEELPSKKYISQLQQLGVFEIEDNQFKPYETLTRGDYIIWLFKANNAIRPEKEHLVLDPTYNPEFTDLSKDHPAFKYVQAFANAGYAVGYEDKTFKPDQPITREEMIAIKVGLDTGRNIEPLQGVTLSYADADKVSPRYTGFVWEDHTQDNIPRAFGNIKQFKPKQAVKRFEAASTLWKIRFSTAGVALSQ